MDCICELYCYNTNNTAYVETHTYIYIHSMIHIHVFPHIFVWGSCFWFCIPLLLLLHHRLPVTHTTLSHTIFHTQLCHTPLCHTPIFTNNFVTHSLSHVIFPTQLCHTPLCHTPLCHTQLCHTHNLSHTTLSHTHTIFHTQLCHTHNFVTHSLSHVIFPTQLCHTPLCHTPLCHTQLCHTHHLSHTTLSHTTLSHTPSFTHNFVTHNFVTHHLSRGVALGDIDLLFYVAGVALLALGWIWWCARSPLVARGAAALCVAGVALGDIHLRRFHVAALALGDIHLCFTCIQNVFAVVALTLHRLVVFHCTFVPVYTVQTDVLSAVTSLAGGAGWRGLMWLGANAWSARAMG